MKMKLSQWLEASWLTMNQMFGQQWRKPSILCRNMSVSRLSIKLPTLLEALRQPGGSSSTALQAFEGSDECE